MSMSRREIHIAHNTLVCLAQGLIGEYTIVDLRNESYVTGRLDLVDGCMNISMSDAVFTNQRGEEFQYDFFFIKERNVRDIHIPAYLSIRDTMEKGLERLTIKKFPKKMTYRDKRLQQNQRETIALIEKMKKDRLERKNN